MPEFILFFYHKLNTLFLRVIVELLREKMQWNAPTILSRIITTIRLIIFIR